MFEIFNRKSEEEQERDLARAPVSQGLTGIQVKNVGGVPEEKMDPATEAAIQAAVINEETLDVPPSKTQLPDTTVYPPTKKPENLEGTLPARLQMDAPNLLEEKAVPTPENMPSLAKENEVQVAPETPQNYESAEITHLDAFRKKSGAVSGGEPLTKLVEKAEISNRDAANLIKETLDALQVAKDTGSTQEAKNEYEKKPVYPAPVPNVINTPGTNTPNPGEVPVTAKTEPEKLPEEPLNERDALRKAVMLATESRNNSMPLREAA